MITPDDIFGIADEATFAHAALEIFRRQARDCAPYREYLARIGVRPESVLRPEEIPYLPIELFKTHTVYCGETPPEVVFTSSATTGMTPSRHPMRSLALYEQAFRTAFRTFYGDPAGLSLYALLPNYLRRRSTWPTGFWPIADRAASTSTTTTPCWQRWSRTRSRKSCWA